MSKNVKIDGIDYPLELLTPSQQLIAQHVNDLDRKIGSAQFNLDQLRVGRNAFAQMLKISFEEVANG